MAFGVTPNAHRKPLTRVGAHITYCSERRAYYDIRSDLLVVRLHKRVPSRLKRTYDSLCHYGVGRCKQRVAIGRCLEAISTIDPVYQRQTRIL